MAVSSGVYGTNLLAALQTTPNPDLSNETSGTFYVGMVTDSHTPDFHNDDKRDDISNEVTGTGYTAGGTSGGAASLTKQNSVSSGSVVFALGTDPAWTSSTISNAEAAFVYKHDALDDNTRLVCMIDFGSSFSSTSGTFTIDFNAAASGGVFHIKYVA